MQAGDIGAVIAAAGASSRMQGQDKLWVDLGGQPLLARTLEAFEAAPSVRRVAIVTCLSSLDRVRSLSRQFAKVSAVCEGGANRQASVLEGLRALGRCGIVAVHDGARPLITPELIEKGIEAAVRHGAALCAVRAKSTHKLVEDGLVVSTPPRVLLWEAQTPQVFRYDDLLAAHEWALTHGEEYTDDAALMEAMGHAVHVYEGSYRNVKVTTPEDLVVVEALFRAYGRER